MSHEIQKLLRSYLFLLKHEIFNNFVFILLNKNWNFFLFNLKNTFLVHRALLTNVVYEIFVNGFFFFLILY